MYRSLINKFYEFFLKKKFIVKSKKISILIKKILPKNYFFYIIDVGAGGRYLPSVLNFDGSSKVFMIDPNDNLNTSYNNLLKITVNKKNIIPIKEGIHKKNGIINYYQAKKSTGSSFINYDDDLKKTKKKVHTYQYLKKKYKILKVDILKVDIEGLELSVLKDVLSFSTPLIIEVEVNFKDSVFGDTFTSIHSLLSKKYFLKTGYPTFKKNENKFNGNLSPFRQGSYASPSFRNPINQMDCYYILKKKNYNIYDLLLLIGYGFFDEAKKIIKILDKQLNINERENLKKICNYFHEK
jgi:FkbM family methyltransferase|tara:strand:- start:2820 stop:3707 length:888 start_codon:yes stop_codon:yes gene_type:complete